MDKKDKVHNLRSKSEIVLNEKNTKLRWFLVLVFFFIAAVAFGVGIVSLLNTDPGWQEIQANSTSLNCSEDFILNYEFRAGDGDLATANKRLNLLYTELTERGYSLFNPEAPTSVGNLRAVNEAPNQAVTVEPELYRALSQVVEKGNRTVYLAPVNAQYFQLFQCQSPAVAQTMDPTQNPEQAAWNQQLAEFASDPQSVQLELLPDHQVRLFVSQDYLAFAESYELDVFVDFGWMKNAFIADFIADALTENGFCNGYLVSFDGFTRNLDKEDTSFHQNFFDRLENEIYLPARVNYTAGASLVSMRNFPMSERDRWSYYAFPDSHIVTSYIDPADGMYKSATDHLLGYSTQMGCAQLAMELSRVYIAEKWDTEQVTELQKQGIFCLWAEGTSLRKTGPLQVELLPTHEGPAYRIEE